MSRYSATVLVVDDDEDVRSLAVTILHDAGYRALPAPNGDTALAMLQGGLNVDLLFTDIVMPGGIDGFTLAYEARQIQPDIAVLYATGFNNLSSRGLARSVPGKMLNKPYRAAQLAAEAMKALSENHWLEDRPGQRI
jgi:CheY-like chemotaxis protein